MRWVPVLVFGFAACASATPSGGAPGEPDAAQPEIDSSVVVLDAPPPQLDAQPIDGSIEPPVPVDVTISQTTNNTIAAPNTVACVDFFDATTEHSYYRVFPLADYGITGDFHVKSVQFAVEAAESGSGTTQGATINVGTYTGAIAANTATLAGGQWFPAASAGVTVSDGASMMMNVPIDVVIPAGSKLMVELRSPDDGNRFFPGSNKSGETYPSFVRMPACEDGINSYTTLGYDVDLVMTVTGTK